MYISKSDFVKAEGKGNKKGKLTLGEAEVDIPLPAFIVRYIADRI